MLFYFPRWGLLPFFFGLVCSGSACTSQQFELGALPSQKASIAFTSERPSGLSGIWVAQGDQIGCAPSSSLVLSAVALTLNAQRAHQSEEAPLDASLVFWTTQLALDRSPSSVIVEIPHLSYSIDIPNAKLTLSASDASSPLIYSSDSPSVQLDEVERKAIIDSFDFLPLSGYLDQLKQGTQGSYTFILSAGPQGSLLKLDPIQNEPFFCWKNLDNASSSVSKGEPPPSSLVSPSSPSIQLTAFHSTSSFPAGLAWVQAQIYAGAERAPASVDSDSTQRSDSRIHLRKDAQLPHSPWQFILW